MSGGPYDPRAVANLMLDEADRSDGDAMCMEIEALPFVADRDVILFPDGCQKAD